MNHKILRRSFILCASFAFLLPTSGLADTNEELASRVSTDLRNCEFEMRDEFVAFYKSKHDKFTANLEQVRANHSAALASPELNAAMDKLEADDATFQQKLTEAGDATVETWYAARDSVAASWDKLQASYAEVSGG